MPEYFSNLSPDWRLSNERAGLFYAAFNTWSEWNGQLKIYINHMTAMLLQMTSHQELIDKSTKLGITKESNSVDWYPVGADLRLGKRMDLFIYISFIWSKHAVLIICQEMEGKKD